MFQSARFNSAHVIIAMQDFGFTSAQLPLNQGSRPSSDSTSADLVRGFRRRQRKTKAQVHALAEAFKAGRIWTSEEIQTLAAETGLKPLQITKWRWDYDQKLLRDSRQTRSLLHCSEKLQQLPVQIALRTLQQRYEAELHQDSGSPSRLLA